MFITRTCQIRRTENNQNIANSFKVAFLFLDSRLMSYRPSTLAVAIMIHVISEVEPLSAMEHRNQLMVLLKISEVCVLPTSTVSRFCKFCY